MMERPIVGLKCICQLGFRGECVLETLGDEILACKGAFGSSGEDQAMNAGQGVYLPMEKAGSERCHSRPLMELSLRIRGIYRVRFEALALLGFFALEVVFAAAAFFRVEEALVGVSEVVELAFLRATRLGFFSVGAEASNCLVLALALAGLEPGLVVAATFFATACTSSSSLHCLASIRSQRMRSA